LGNLDLKKEEEDIISDLQSMKEFLPILAVLFMDDVGEILKESLQLFTPIGDTQQLHDLIVVESMGDLVRYIYSEADHFDPVVDGHMVYGPVFSDKQRRWWFWYLDAVLGGSYEPKVGSGNKLPANDYPSLAVEDADGSIELRAEEFLDQIVG
jgi:hypothetical protein